MACAVASSRAIAADAEAAFEYVVMDGGAEISGFSNPNDRTANLVIPDSIGGCPVVSIRFNAFFCNSNLRSVTIPNSVTNIGSCAFGCCVNLEAFSVSGEGGALVSVDGILFSRDMTRLVACPGAKERVVVPDSVVSICRYAFDGLAPGVTVDGAPLSTYAKVCPSLALGCAAPAEVAQLNVADGKLAMSVRFMVKCALDEREWKDVKAESADVEPDGTVSVRLACPDGSCGFYLLGSSPR